MSLSLSIVVPFFNEEETIEKLHEKIVAAVAPTGCPFEVIYVNDGSTDLGPIKAQKLVGSSALASLINFRTNFGKAAALSAGFRRARGDIVITMDADLQDDPMEIPRFLEQIHSGIDVVSGWKQKRHDPLGKTLPSKLFNAVVGRVFGLRLHDYNCGFKAYRRSALAHLNLYGELHRFTPALLHSLGFQVSEIPVTHHPRTHGQSKYGWSRLIKGMIDLFTVLLSTRFRMRPAHLFAYIGLPITGAGFAALAYLTVLWLVGAGPIGSRPLLFFGIMAVLFGTQMIATGLIAEVVRASRPQEDEKYLVESEYGSSGELMSQPLQTNQHDATTTAQTPPQPAGRRSA
ncbi:glycosyltransferase family 2 protein [Pelagibius litoralis]|uniref:Glycosyltransferase family 2 protein n=1 Tax=Pelagibius litoralis TaxID=374515 RepID=A0A967C1I9_9PROT|nr:glycosyltransferase family 2 protein [Pelagibius litoralis]NIA67216.1 glycosyltransferase family 2 protein [Pelagibius litoralis]